MTKFLEPHTRFGESQRRKQAVVQSPVHLLGRLKTGLAGNKMPKTQPSSRNMKHYSCFGASRKTNHTSKRKVKLRSNFMAWFLLTLAQVAFAATDGSLEQLIQQARGMVETHATKVEAERTWNYRRDFAARNVSCDSLFAGGNYNVYPNSNASLVEYTICGGVPPQLKTAIVEKAIASGDTKLLRAMACMAGMVIGDAWGAPFDHCWYIPFRISLWRLKSTALAVVKSTDPADFPDRSSMLKIQENGDLEYECTNEINKFKLKKGQWTDNGSMGLCTADSLILNGISLTQGTDKLFSDMRVRIFNWWYRGYNNTFRLDKERSPKTSFGVKVGYFLDSLRSHVFDPKRQKWKSSGPPPKVALDIESYRSLEYTGRKKRTPSIHLDGYASLARLAPVSVFCSGLCSSQAGLLAMESSHTTHPGSIPAEACALLNFICHQAINRAAAPGDTMKLFLDRVTAEYLSRLGDPQNFKPNDGKYEINKLLHSNEPAESKEINWNWKHPHLQFDRAISNRKPEETDPAQFGTDAIDGLAMALHACYSTSSFDNAVIKAVNMLGKASSTAAIAGQIAGAFYGINSINSRFMEAMNKWDDNDVLLRAVLLYTMNSKIKPRAGASEGDRNVEDGETTPGTHGQAPQTENPKQDGPLQRILDNIARLQANLS